MAQKRQQKTKKRDEKTKAKNIYHVVNPQNQEGRLAVTWFRRKWEGAIFFMGFQKSFAELAEKRLRGEALKVFVLILGQMDYSNLVNTSQVEMARKLGIRKQNVYRAIKALVKEGILIEEIDDKRKRQLKLNHLYAWKGKLKHLGLRPQEIAEKEKHK